MNRFYCLLLIGLLCGCGFCGRSWGDETSESQADSNAGKQSLDEALQRGLEWIRRQQGKDGGWCSVNYAPLRPGAGITARILAVLAELPPQDRIRRTDEYQRGVQFLSRKLQAGESGRGSLEQVDYPVYTAACLLDAQARGDPGESLVMKSELIAFLLRQQRTSQNGWPADGADIGGWSPWIETPGEVTAQPPANVSVTCCVLEALHTAGVLTDDVKGEAARFLSRCLAPVAGSAGLRGMTFTPWPDSPFNKGGTIRTAEGAIRPLAYHSATADGLRIMKLLSASPEGVSLEDVLQGYRQTPRARLVTNPEFEGESERLQSALFFYDAAAFGRVWQMSPEKFLEGDRARLLTILVRSQHEDGSWTNLLPWFFEDDPLIATPLAVSALIRLNSR